MFIQCYTVYYTCLFSVTQCTMSIQCYTVYYADVYIDKVCYVPPGPTMKLKRPVVVKMYQKTIDAFYD